jgi:hypothetical protein
MQIYTVFCQAWRCWYRDDVRKLDKMVLLIGNLLSVTKWHPFSFTLLAPTPATPTSDSRYQVEPTCRISIKNSSNIQWVSMNLTKLCQYADLLFIIPESNDHSLTFMMNWVDGNNYRGCLNLHSNEAQFVRVVAIVCWMVCFDK